jgi:hypothetical protein
MNRREFIQTTSLAAAATFPNPSFFNWQKSPIDNCSRSQLFGIAAAYQLKLTLENNQFYTHWKRLLTLLLNVNQSSNI